MSEHGKGCLFWAYEEPSACTCGVFLDEVRARLAKLEAAAKLAARALKGFEAEEWTMRADWIGLCPFRRHEIRCQGTDGRNAPVGQPRPTPHDEHCPYRDLDAALAALRDAGVEP